MPADSDLKEIKRAAEILRRGGIVAFPTETVYGLGADATNSAAVEKIFAAKGRPATNPLIVHVCDSAAAQLCTTSWPPAAEKLSKAFWPGPLTLVLPKSDRIVSRVTAGRSTVAVRAPDHPVAQSLLQHFGGPVAAPSANRSQRLSPTTADHVKSQLAGRVDMILDGGPCRVGIESTVLDLTTDPPTLLRPGGVLASQIEELIGPIRHHSALINPTESAPSPGMSAVHYSPLTPAFLLNSESWQKWRTPLIHLQHIVILAMSGSPLAVEIAQVCANCRTIVMPANPIDFGHNLYTALHEADQMQPTLILIEQPPVAPPWHPILDRLHRACRSVDQIASIVC